MVTRIFKGAAPGTHWHSVDARLYNGFVCHAGIPGSPGDIVRHIVNGSYPSAYTSFTHSYAVAADYAMLGPGGVASPANPGFVYEIDLSRAQGFPCDVIDPIVEIVRSSQGGLHLHNGGQGLIHAIASGNQSYLTRIPLQLGNSARPHYVSEELVALVSAIRDAEILARIVPGVCIVARHDVT